MSEQSGSRRRPSWLNYGAVWRWHFYAGLFCLPFICWLSVTGSLYIFRPDIEAWLNRPYENIRLDHPRAEPSAEAAAAVAAVPGSRFSRYETPATATGAAQIVVSKDGGLVRVYVHPGDLHAMRIEQDDHRIMERISNLHGNLLLGDRGSVLVELAASWAIVMILTGLYLWFPRRARGLAGIVYPRLRAGGRIFWRDLHAVTGLWISVVTLFMLLSGLPWSTAWGAYLTWARDLSAVTSVPPDWPVGATPAALPKPKAAEQSSMPGMTAAEMAAMAPAQQPEQSSMPGMTPAEMAAMVPSDTSAAATPGHDLAALDRVVPVAIRLQVPRPLWILPPDKAGGDWTIASQVQDRPRRISYTVAGGSGDVTGTSDFAHKNIVDKVVNVAVATHEGQLFGRLNQAMLLATATGLVLLSVSAVVMWWRRRPGGTLGAPLSRQAPRFPLSLIIAIAVLAVLLPLFGLSLLAVLIVDRTLLRGLPQARRWLGLRPMSS